MSSTNTIPLHDALRVLAAAGGALHMDDLADRLGFDIETREWDRAFEALLDGHERIVVLSGDRVGDVVSLLAGTTLTHRLSAEEAEGGRLATFVDLAPLVVLVEGSVPLAGGGRARLESGISPLGVPQSHLVGPARWLGGAGAGELVGFRLVEGRLAVVPRPRTDDAQAAARALAEGARRSLDVVATFMDEPSDPLDEVLAEALAGDPVAGAPPAGALATVLPPLAELVDAAGLNRHGEQILASDLDSPPSDPRRFGMAMSGALYGIDADEAEQLQDLREARAAVLDAATPAEDTRSLCAAAFAAPAVAYLFAEENDDEAADAVARAVADADPGPAALAGALLVRSRAAEARGDHGEAEGLLAGALDAAPDHPLAVADAAWYAEDRGDARHALSLLRRVPHPDPEDLDRLRDILAAKPADVGRNEPCPCGSGRKFKVCCTRRDGGSLADRAVWVVDKLVAYAVRAPQRRRLDPLVEARGLQGSAVDTEPSVDPLVLDAGMFDLGLLDDFLARRGRLLPDDERALAEAWRDTRRALYRLERQRGEVLDLVDVDRDEAVTARAVGASSLAPGTLLLGRVVPSGGSVPLVFWVPLVLGELAVTPGFLAFVDGADPQALAGAFPRGRPWVRTTEGEPMVACERGYRLPGDAEEARAALRRTHLDEDAGTGAFNELVEVAGATRVRGSVTVAEGELRVTASSDARMSRLVALVEGAVAGLGLLVEHRTPMWLAAEDLDRYGVPLERDTLSGDAQAGMIAFLADRTWRAESLALSEEQQCRAFVAPPAAGEHDGIDLSLLDPDDPDDRALLIAAEHPEHADALEAGRDVVDDRGEALSPQLHLAMHELVANQLWDDDPPEMWQTARRLLATGYDRHEVLHLLAGVAAEETQRMLQREELFDRERYVRALDALPGSWEAPRPRPRRGARPLPPGAGHPH